MQQVGPQELAKPESRRDFLRVMKRRPAEQPPAAPASSSASSPASSPSSSASAHWDPAMARVAPPSPWADARVRLVRRATYGPRAADIADVRAVGYQRWLNDQVTMRIDDSTVDAEVAARWPNLSRNGIDLVNVNAGTLRTELQAATLHRATFSRRQLYERMVEFWTDHFSIDIEKVGYLKVLDDREVIRKHALGKFSDLLKASAKSPAMLAYLDQNLSRAGAPNQNYVRELMELHTLGVDGGYTQQDVDELARVFTGWTIAGAGDFAFNASRHDFGAKTVLGTTIPAASPSTGAEGVKEGELMLDVLLKHPSTGRFLATKLLKWFVTPEPTTEQIDAVAGAYRATGGDIKRMVRATLNEGWLAQAPLKLKRPFHLVASALRGTSAVVANISGSLNSVTALGQPLFLWDTPDGFPDLMEYWVGNITPRWSFATSLASSNSATTVRVNVAPYLTGTPDAALDRLNAEMFGGEMAPATRDQLRAYLTGGTFNETRMREALSLAMCSHDFQWF
ncbi:DUF1800 domain-containing protein [Gemmatimonas sp.]|jgi:uncharacterized protein (DUF1800 family)|uniref:DUF1800 domain-containing protein n=1 Tax=Gemmatimonas sp. TaxID=1962908 RepID=UPI0037C0B781